MIEKPISLLTAVVFTAGAFYQGKCPANEQPITPFAEIIENFTEVSSGSQAALMFNINLEKKSIFYSPKHVYYGFSDRNSWVVIDD